MNHPHHTIVRSFIEGLGQGTITNAMFTSDMTVWTATGGRNTGDYYVSGVKVLQSLFPKGLQYFIDVVTAEGDRAIAEVRGVGTLANGQEYRNDYVFVFAIRDGLIAEIKEHTNPDPVRELIKPLLSR